MGEATRMRILWVTAVALAAALSGAAPALAVASGSFSAGARARIEFDIGVDLVNHRAYADAMPHLEAALNEFPDDADILIYLGFVHRMVAAGSSGTARDGELRLANTYYRRALEADPSNRAFLEYMGELYLDMNDIGAAREKLRALETECPQGCAEREGLARSIAAYVPPANPSAPGALAPAPTR
jgi:tetratricopeptide (TPR) repeat protein